MNKAIEKALKDWDRISSEIRMLDSTRLELSDQIAVLLHDVKLNKESIRLYNEKLLLRQQKFNAPKNVADKQSVVLLEQIKNYESVEPKLIGRLADTINSYKDIIIDIGFKNSALKITKELISHLRNGFDPVAYFRSVNDPEILNILTEKSSWFEVLDVLNIPEIVDIAEIADISQVDPKKQVLLGRPMQLFDNLRLSTALKILDSQMSVRDFITGWSSELMKVRGFWSAFLDKIEKQLAVYGLHLYMNDNDIDMWLKSWFVVDGVFAKKQIDQYDIKQETGKTNTKDESIDRYRLKWGLETWSTPFEYINENSKDSDNWVLKEIEISWSSQDLQDIGDISNIKNDESSLVLDTKISDLNLPANLSAKLKSNWVLTIGDFMWHSHSDLRIMLNMRAESFKKIDAKLKKYALRLGMTFDEIQLWKKNRDSKNAWFSSSIDMWFELQDISPSYNQWEDTDSQDIIGNLSQSEAASDTSYHIHDQVVEEKLDIKMMDRRSSKILSTDLGSLMSLPLFRWIKSCLKNPRALYFFSRGGKFCIWDFVMISQERLEKCSFYNSKTAQEIYTILGQYKLRMWMTPTDIIARSQTIS